ncbi:uncharacterized protein LOC124258811 isoform X1 [Haliotis rubra]|uniref:uncharacterized protein LOC124258811 isoform X1 n=1 Tax=Haliotis rubra TaxID=36100 RepID=UPI001EE52754|nr:uncharacterized protein LOC124258811 isoform X1 [Haliotis rubra]
MKGPVSVGCRIGATAINKLSDKLTLYSKYIPREFCRKGRSLREIDRWKATEYRLFLLYTGPVALNDILCNAVYLNFLLLFVGITCLATPLLVPNYCDYAKDNLCLFVEHFSRLYGNDMVVYNLHGLVHLSQDVKRFGPLDNFSSFPFESFLGKLKKLLRTPKCPLQQIIRRLGESQVPLHKGKHVSENQGVKFEHSDGPILSNLGYVTQYKEIHMDRFFLSKSIGNSCVSINNEVVIIKNIVQNANKDILIIYAKFLSKKDFFTYPLKSSSIGIFKVSHLSDHLYVGGGITNSKEICYLT